MRRRTHPFWALAMLLSTAAPALARGGDSIGNAAPDRLNISCGTAIQVWERRHVGTFYAIANEEVIDPVAVQRNRQEPVVRVFDPASSDHPGHSLLLTIHLDSETLDGFISELVLGGVTRRLRCTFASEIPEG